ncbi:putative metallophosphoesterase At3g03305 [Zingiber officinale]|uniref:putative metallophosphoesterase At3g03305 n=1 Tax=Zingiber officinale TaxID=94328 RepID=UPI001C4BA996|nr:putative metallophosphoesterase At3g03305 [Zingiber officinale]
MAALEWALLLVLVAAAAQTLPMDTGEDSPAPRGRVIEVEEGPKSVVWVVQLSDLHISVHHPERAYDLQRYLGPALAMINPSLVLITGDLTDGKSKDLLTMKLDEVEWKEYQNVVDNIIQGSGLNKDIFYDLRGNHDCFGVPKAGGAYDYYHKYSINARTGRKGNVQSITLQNGRWRHLFVGFDSTMETSLRGPTNVFGHPTDKLLVDIDLELSQWDAESLVTKISFGHFPLSFSTLTDAGKSLRDVFLKHSLSAYLCGHLHTKFGNLKRHHQLDHSVNYFQNIHQEGFLSNNDNHNCSSKSVPLNEFWEWEMGDWRRSRTMRVLAIDSGHVSYVDIDFRLGSKDTIILPTFPLDSRFMQRISSVRDFKCQPERGSSYELVRTLVFSRQKIVLVSVKIYDTQYGTPNIVLDSNMEKVEGNRTRGDLYVAPWNWRAFADPSPSRYWLQITALDNFGKTSFSELRPFSINGLAAQVSWSWKEFRVMGLHWPSIYHPAFWSVLSFMFLLLVIPQVLFLFWNKLLTYEYVRPTNARSNKEHLVDAALLALMEFPRMTIVWLGFLLYLLYLSFFPWFFGHVFGELDAKASMSYQGWFIPKSDKNPDLRYVGVPDIMVVVLPHLCFVVLPTILVVGAMVAERTTHRRYFLLLSGKKDDGFSRDKNGQPKNVTSCYSHRICHGRWIRKLLFLVIALILWKHFKNCRDLVRAYDMNPIIDSPIYCFVIPVLLIYAAYKTSAV